MINKERVIKRFIDYVKISSESGHEKDFAVHLKSELETIGFSIEFDNAGETFGGDCGNLIAKLKGTVKGNPILFSAHMDTAAPGENIKPIIKDEIIYSDGTTVLAGDDKAGIAVIVEGIVTLIENDIDHTDIELLFTISEEDGLKGSKYLDVNRISSKDGYIFDSNNSPGEIITQAPAETGINVTVYGKAAHAGVCPEEGINALQVLSKAVQDMKLLRIDADTTANIGLVNGGIASHVVMPNIDIAAEVRSLYPDKLNEQINHMRRCFEKATQIYGGSFDFEEVPYYNTMYVKEDTSIVLNAIEAFKQVGIDAVTTSTGGGSDANVLNDKGLTMINLGINQKQAHTLDEHYCISDLVLLTNFVVELIKQHTLNKN